MAVMGQWAPRTASFMLRALALYKIDFSEVSLLYLLRKIWANGHLEQHDDLCWWPMRSMKLII